MQPSGTSVIIKWSTGEFAYVDLQRYSCMGRCYKM